MSFNKVIEIQTIDFSVPTDNTSGNNDFSIRLSNLENNVQNLNSQINNNFDSKLDCFEQDLIL